MSSSLRPAPAARRPFSGSYAPDDVDFLLKPVAMTATDTAEKERLIQSGARHYSEMLPEERVPGPRYLALYETALAMHGARLGRDVARLARTLAARRPAGEIVLVSLARAGTPVGALLRRALRVLGREAPHYSVSIIRDRGIDAVALDYVCARHDPAAVVFVDGWTGKGAIGTELRATIADYRASRGAAAGGLAPTLAVVTDLAGVADVAVTADDYLMPSSILNAVVSGLVSRTVLNVEHVGPGDFHACVYYDHLEPHDRSRAFLDAVHPHVLAALAAADAGPVDWSPAVRAPLAAASRRFVADAMARYGVSDRNRVKPGIGESTRALLRRVPDRLILQDRTGADVRHLVHLADAAGVPVDLDPALPYRATVIIKTLGE